MKLPLWVKHMAKCVDPDSTRYVFGAIQTVVRSGVAYLCATDGRMLVRASYRTKSADCEANIEAKSLTKAVQATAGRSGVVSLTTDGKTATVSSNGATASAQCVPDGRFPDAEKVFAEIYEEPSKYVRFAVDPRLLGKLCDVFSAIVTDDRKAVELFVQNGTKAMFLCHTTEAGEVIRAALMPVEVDDPQPFPQPVPVEKAAAGGWKEIRDAADVVRSMLSGDENKDEAAAPVVMKPVLGTKPRTSGKKRVEFTPSPMQVESISGVPGVGVAKTAWMKVPSWMAAAESGVAE